MGLRSATIGRLDRAAAVLAAAETSREAVPEPAPRPGDYPDKITRAIAEAQAALWLGATAEAIPPIRRAVRLICGTVGSWRLGVWRDGRQLPPSYVPWVAQPDPARTCQEILSWSLHDGIWHDRAVWRSVPGGWRRISPGRISDVPGDDQDDPPVIHVDGEIPRDQLVVFRWGGAGGLRSLTLPLLGLLGDVFAAASRYASTPAPELVLKNTGTDIGPVQIAELLDQWDEGRRNRTTGYLNAYLDAIQVGYSAKDLQLIEAMDELSKEVARMFGLPAPALGVSAGDSLTYSTTIEQRRDLIASLQPWRSGIEQTLSMGEYAVQLGAGGVTAVRRGAYVPWGSEVRLDSADFEREGWSDRMKTLGASIAAVGPDGRPLLGVDEAREMEPTIKAVSA